MQSPSVFTIGECPASCYIPKTCKCSDFLDASSSFANCLQLVPWTQAKEDQEPDAPCVRLDIEAVNRVVFEELKLSWDELDFIGIKKVSSLVPKGLSLQPAHSAFAKDHNACAFV